MSARAGTRGEQALRRARGGGRGVLVVGDSPAIHAVVSRLADPPLAAEDLFSGLGEVAAAPGGRAIAVVIISHELVAGDAHAVCDAFRSVDPSVDLHVAMDQSAADLAADCAEAFDGVLVADENGAMSDDALAPLMVDLKPDHRDRAPGANGVESPATVNGPSRASGAIATPIVELPLAPPAEPTPELGDTDLVAAILSPSGEFLPVALTLIAQQTSWNDIALIGADDEGGPSPAGPLARLTAEVEYAGHRFGRLASAQASAAELAPWAEWLAHWLALGRALQTQRALADHDELTGALNRRAFKRFLRESIDRAHTARRPVTVMVYDIDDFKKYNDVHGHAAGDEILRETVRLLNSVIRRGDRVFRIGGDEFAVVFADPEGPRTPGTTHPENIEGIARRFQDQICRLKFPKLGPEAHGSLSISAGLAAYPWDGHDPEALLEHADRLALQSKQRGKNALTLGPGARTICGKQDEP